MRRRTADFLQGKPLSPFILHGPKFLIVLKVLRRARPENEEKERKTASGRTFKVQGS
jgi:hypothetical protein